MTGSIFISCVSNEFRAHRDLLAQNLKLPNLRAVSCAAVGEPLVLRCSKGRGLHVGVHFHFVCFG